MVKRARNALDVLTASEALNALDSLGSIPDLARIVEQANTAVDWPRRHEESIRQLTSNPIGEAVQRQQEWAQRIIANPANDALRSAASSVGLLRASEAFENAPIFKASLDVAELPMVKAAQAAGEAVGRANLPFTEESQRLAKMVDSPLLDAYKAIENSPAFKMNEVLVEQMRASEWQFTAVAQLAARVEDSPVFAAAREAQAFIDHFSVSMPDWTKVAVDFERLTGASSEAWERFRDEVQSVVEDPEHAEDPFAEMAAIADAIVADVPEAQRVEARRFMRDLMIGVLATAIVELGKEGAKRVWPYLLTLMFGIASPVSVPKPVALPPAQVPAIVAPAPPPDWRVEGLPPVVVDAGLAAVRRTLEFFTAEIRNPNTRQAYARVVQEFSNWCEDRNLALKDLTPFHIAAYIEELRKDRSAPTVKQALSALRMWFDYLVVGQVLRMNPAASVRGPKHIVKRGKTPVLHADQARTLLDSIDTSKVVGLRDRALIALMVYSFGRVGAVSGMRVEDYFPVGTRWWFRLHEKGGKRHEVPAHHNAEAYLDAYLDAAGISQQGMGPLFRSIGRNGALSERPMHRTDVLRMIKRRARAAGLPSSTCCHTFRATGITAYLENGGTIEKAQQIAAHESPRTTKLYDRRNDELTLDEIERIVI